MCSDLWSTRGPSPDRRRVRGDAMNDSNDRTKDDEQLKRPPPPKEIKFFDPWEEEFRRAYRDDKTFEF
ncbi:hypothetical protein Bra5_CH03986 [Rhizobium phaseoli Brasil 5]|nr:hypothetical protein Bra5_CH03986 [Rhizobium phaseoli Brasil 5]